jgi:hypothetical protein
MIVIIILPWSISEISKIEFFMLSYQHLQLRKVRVSLFASRFKLLLDRIDFHQLSMVEVLFVQLLLMQFELLFS